MRALRLLAEDRGGLRLLDVPAPEPAPGEVVLRVLGSGVCGTDLHILDGSYASEPPVTLGHEVVGVVESVGAGTDPGLAGRRVAVETFRKTCGYCEWCRGGSPNLCPERRSIGSKEDGGFAELMAIPARNLHALPDGVSDGAAALSEPLACVCRSLLEPPLIAAGDAVLVLGPGTMGLLAAQVARLAGGAVAVAGTERDEHRLGVARELGFAVLDAADREGMTALGDGQGPEVVIECSGAEAAMALGLEVVRRGGRYVQIGQRGDPARVPLALVSFKELEISGGFASAPASWETAMRLLAGGSLALDPLITEVAPLERWQEVFEAVAAGAGIKHVLSPAV